MVLHINVLQDGLGRQPTCHHLLQLAQRLQGQRQQQQQLLGMVALTMTCSGAWARVRLSLPHDCCCCRGTGPCHGRCGRRCYCYSHCKMLLQTASATAAALDLSALFTPAGDIACCPADGVAYDLQWVEPGRGASQPHAAASTCSSTHSNSSSRHQCTAAATAAPTATAATVAVSNTASASNTATTTSSSRSTSSSSSVNSSSNS